MDSKTLLEVKKEYLQYLQDILVEPFLNEFHTIYDTTFKTSSSGKVLQEFQHNVSQVAQWNHVMIEALYERVQDQSKCEFLGDLIRAIFVTYVRFNLASHGKLDSNNQVKIKVPNAANFIHKCLIACARVVWKQPYLFYHAVRTIERQHNRVQADDAFRKAIAATVRNAVPWDQLLNITVGNERLEEENMSSESSYKESESDTESQSDQESESESESESDTVSNPESEQDDVVDVVIPADEEETDQQSIAKINEEQNNNVQSDVADEQNNDELSDEEDLIQLTETDIPQIIADMENQLQIDNNNGYEADNDVNDNAVNDNAVNDNDVNDNAVNDNAVNDNDVNDNDVNDNDVNDNDVNVDVSLKDTAVNEDEEDDGDKKYDDDSDPDLDEDTIVIHKQDADLVTTAFTDDTMNAQAVYVSGSDSEHEVKRTVIIDSKKVHRPKYAPKARITDAFF